MAELTSNGAARARNLLLHYLRSCIPQSLLQRSRGYVCHELSLFFVPDNSLSVLSILTQSLLCQCFEFVQTGELSLYTGQLSACRAYVCALQPLVHTELSAKATQHLFGRRCCARRSPRRQADA